MLFYGSIPLIIIMAIIENHKQWNAYFKRLVFEKKIKIISESVNRLIVDVDGHQVIAQSGGGRTIWMCDCENYTRNCNSPSMCSHRDAARLFLFYQPIFTKLKELTQLAEINDCSQSKIKFEDKYFQTLKRCKLKGIINQNPNEFNEANRIAMKICEEHQTEEKRNANHNYYKMLIEDILRVK